MNESLLSLVGKDHETIVEALKELQTKLLFNEIAEHKEEVNYLWNKLNCKREMTDLLKEEVILQTENK